MLHELSVFFSRKKGLYTRDKSKLFLKQHCEPINGVWSVKVSTRWTYVALNNAVNGCMVVRCTQDLCGDGSSFVWHVAIINSAVSCNSHKCNILVDILKHAMWSYSHSFKVSCNLSAVCLLGSKEYHYIKVINQSGLEIRLGSSMLEGIHFMQKMLDWPAYLFLTVSKTHINIHSVR